MFAVRNSGGLSSSLAAGCWRGDQARRSIPRVTRRFPTARSHRHAGRRAPGRQPTHAAGRHRTNRGPDAWVAIHASRGQAPQRARAARRHHHQRSVSSSRTCAPKRPARTLCRDRTVAHVAPRLGPRRAASAIPHRALQVRHSHAGLWSMTTTHPPSATHRVRSRWLVAADALVRFPYRRRAGHRRP